MKILILCIALAFSITKVNAQTVTDFDTCQYLQQYEGEWRHVNGIDTIRIYLRNNREFFTIGTQNVMDRLWGWHEFKHGNQVIESNYQYRFMNLPYYTDGLNLRNQVSIWLGLGDCTNTSNLLIGNIIDYSQSSETQSVKATLNASKTQMAWHQEPGRYHVNDPVYVGTTLPTDFILIKQ